MVYGCKRSTNKLIKISIALCVVSGVVTWYLNGPDYTLYQYVHHFLPSKVNIYLEYCTTIMMSRLFKVATILCVVAWYLNDPIPQDFSAPWKLRFHQSITKLMITVFEVSDALGIYPFEQCFRTLIKKRPKLEPPEHLTVTDLDDFDGVKVRMYRPKAESKDGHRLPAMVFYHGGGWILGSPAGYDQLLFEISAEIDIIIISVDYRLAPEFPFPVPFDDCVKATKHFLSNAQKFGVDPRRVAVAGDSSGGNLAAAVSLKLRDDNFSPMPNRQLLVYPALQAMDFSVPSYVQNRHGPYLKTGMMCKMWSMYATGSNEYGLAMTRNEHTPSSVKENNRLINHDDLPGECRYPPYQEPNMIDGGGAVWEKFKEVFENPYFAPLMAPSLAGIPWTFMYTARHDILRDDGILYVKRLRQAGVPVTHVHKNNSFHGMCSYNKLFEEGRQCLDEVVKFLKEL